MESMDGLRICSQNVVSLITWSRLQERFPMRENWRRFRVFLYLATVSNNPYESGAAMLLKFAHLARIENPHCLSAYSNNDLAG